MTRRKAIRFDGYDWTELLQLKLIAGHKWPKKPQKLEIGKHMSQDDALAVYLITVYLDGLMYRQDRAAERRKVTQYVRKFCTALSGCKFDYSAPIYAGMAKVEDDETLLKWVLRNLETMWT